MIQFAAAGALMKNLPWKKIIIALAIAAVAGTIVLYIRNAEKNRAAVQTLQAEKAALIQANAALEASHQNTVDALQDSITQTLEREQEHAKNVEQISRIPDAGCGRNSLPLRAAIRLLRGETVGSDAAAAEGAGGVSEANPGAAAAQ